MFQNIDITEVVLGYLCLLFSLCVHEAAHAAMADRLGDPTARLLGRLSLNPLAHIDPVGTVVMPLLMMTSGVRFLIGWAKPVPVNPRNLRNMRRDQVLVAAAGPASNLAMALIVALVLRIAVMMTDPATAMTSPIFMVFIYMVFINLALMVFNLIPVPPLDGSWVLHYFLPPSGQRMLESVGPYGILIILFIGRPLIQGPMKFLSDLFMKFIFA